MNLFTEKELIIMGGIVLGLLVLTFIWVIIEIVLRRKEREFLANLLEEDLSETKKFLKFQEEEIEENENVLEIDNQEDLTVEVEPLEIQKEEKEVTQVVKEEIESLIMEVEPVVNVVKIETLEESEMDKQQKAQIELLKLEEELEQNFSLEDTITNLEAIEEENAIISYQELLENTGELDKVLMDDGDEPITINEVFNLFNQDQEEKEMEIEKVTALPLNEAYQGDFEATPYVSPINGLEFESLSEIQLENTANLEKLDKEIRKTNEFLNILNELKKNLE